MGIFFSYAAFHLSLAALKRLRFVQYRIFSEKSPVLPKNGRGVAGCPRGGGSGKPAQSVGLTRRGKLPPAK
jgi:hypothetical protein